LKEASVSEVSTIGLDIAKQVFQAHGADASGHVLFRKSAARRSGPERASIRIRMATGVVP
jgi:transposase